MAENTEGMINALQKGMLPGARNMLDDFRYLNELSSSGPTNKLQSVIHAANKSLHDWVVGASMTWNPVARQSSQFYDDSNYHSVNLEELETNHRTAMEEVHAAVETDEKMPSQRDCEGQPSSCAFDKSVQSAETKKSHNSDFKEIGGN